MAVGTGEALGSPPAPQKVHQALEVGRQLADPGRIRVRVVGEVRRGATLPGIALGGQGGRPQAGAGQERRDDSRLHGRDVYLRRGRRGSASVAADRTWSGPPPPLSEAGADRPRVSSARSHATEAGSAGQPDAAIPRIHGNDDALQALVTDSSPAHVPELDPVRRGCVRVPRRLGEPRASPVLLDSRRAGP